VWADGPVPVPVDAELGEFEADARPEVLGVLDLNWVGLVVVDVDVEATADAIVERFGKRPVGGAEDAGLRVAEALAVVVAVVCQLYGSGFVPRQRGGV